MIQYDMLKTANQTFNVILNDHVVDLWFRSFRGNIYCSCYIDDELVEAGNKAHLNKDLFSSNIKLLLGGNFRFISTTEKSIALDKLNGYDIAFVFI